MGTLWLSFLLFLSVAYCDPCSNGYIQGPFGGDCFKCKTFYDYFATQYFSKTFDEAEIECNKDGGGLLASIHSEEDFRAALKTSCNRVWSNIGLKCTGKDCKWDDGSPLVYENFRGSGPSDDGVTRCYGWDGSLPFGEWQGRKCGKEDADCWICRVKARTIDCADGETEYKGGCISVHSTPLDQKTAEASCPGGGHLVSIHSIAYGENDVYKKAALAAGVNGTIYIGGQFSNGVFEWLDGSYYGANNWAKGFPNTIFGTCVQMLLDSEFGSQGQWTNIGCDVKQPYMCFRDGSENGPTAAPHPKADAHCPTVQYFTESGTVFSPNYPLSIPAQQTCEYVLGALEGSRASIKFTAFDCQSGTSISLYDGLNSKEPFASFSSTLPEVNFTSGSNVLKMVFTSSDSSAPVGTGWAAEFNGI